MRDGEGKTGVGKSGKRFAEDGDALSKQRSGENAGMAVCQESAKGRMDCLHQKNKMEGD